MSLTREQWEEMWRSTKIMERILLGKTTITKSQRDIMYWEVEKIQGQIQSVVGQME